MTENEAEKILPDGGESRKVEKPGIELIPKKADPKGIRSSDKVASPCVVRAGRGATGFRRPQDEVHFEGGKGIATSTDPVRVLNVRD